MELSLPFAASCCTEVMSENCAKALELNVNRGLLRRFTEVSSSEDSCCLDGQKFGAKKLSQFLVILSCRWHHHSRCQPEALCRRLVACSMGHMPQDSGCEGPTCSAKGSTGLWIEMGQTNFSCVFRRTGA